jgi:hypothetical protein
LKPLLSIIVHARWDDEAKVWVATSGDIDGLSVEAETVEVLEPKITAAIADLIELNGIVSDLSEIPVYIMAEQVSRVAIPQH